MSMEEIMRGRHFATELGIDVVVIGTSPATEKAISQAIETGAITEVAVRTRLWCDDCERHEVVCECVANDDRENGCYEFEQFQNCKHKQPGEEKKGDSK